MKLSQGPPGGFFLADVCVFHRDGRSADPGVTNGELACARTQGTGCPPPESRGSLPSSVLVKQPC